MIFKTVRKDETTYEVIYSETGAEYNKRKLEFQIGEVLNELLDFDFNSFNIFIKDNMEEICKNHVLNLDIYTDFSRLSDNTKFLIIYTSDIRFLLMRYRNRHYDKSRNFFVSLIKAIELVKSAITNHCDSEAYFRFYFKHYLNILISDSLYESKHELNILNYVFPVAYAYINSESNTNGHTSDQLEELLSKAENNKEYVSKIISFVPDGNIYSQIMSVLKQIYSVNELGNYRIVPISLAKIIEEFTIYPDLQQKFLEAIYKYDSLRSDKSFAFKSIEEYFALCVLECYKNGCPICECTECNKLFVRTSNSRRLCGSSQCLSNNKRRVALQRKNSLGINDANIFSAVFKALCYSKIGNNKSVKNKLAYTNEDGITDEISSKIFTFLCKEINTAYRKDNKLYKKRLYELNGQSQEQARLIYKDWLENIKNLYSRQYVLESYRKSKYGNSTSKKPFSIEYFVIANDFSEILIKEKIINLD